MENAEVGDIVYHKSNPSVHMVIIDFDFQSFAGVTINKLIKCRWVTSNGKVKIQSFNPKELLIY